MLCRGRKAFAWRATVPRGRPMEGHALSWPVFLRAQRHAKRKGLNTDATERVPPGGFRWRATLCRGRKAFA